MKTSLIAGQAPENPAIGPPHGIFAIEYLQMPVMEITGLDWLGETPRRAPVRRGLSRGGRVEVIIIGESRPKD
jgi:hypothetical protein